MVAAGETSARQQAGSVAGAQSTPAINLPKGGGAVRGIGEKFSANPVNGTGTTSIPIAISPGRAGFDPELSLTYDSGAGNGPFGMGWGLSLPGISRKTEKGLPRYDDAGESDVYILSGAEDLVPELDAGGARHEDPDTVPGYVIHRYRPRVEGLFARIERWTHRQSGDIHWRSISADNITTLYGKDAQSRIVDPDERTRIHNWLVCESYDDKGNAIRYEYAGENDANVDTTQANERNRSRSANRYLKRVLYGNRVSRLLEPDLAAQSWMFEVVFDYDEDHYEPLAPDAARPLTEQHRYIRAAAAAGQPWTVRPDPFSHYRAGFEVRSYRRCRRVLMFHHFEELGEEPCLVRSTDFDYADLDYSASPGLAAELDHPGSTRFLSFIRAVGQSGYVRETGQAVLERDGVRYVTYLKKSLPPLEFDYSRARVQDAVHTLDPESLENLPVGLDGDSYRWVDLDGEGISGILSDQGGAWHYKANLGSGTFAPVQTLPELPAGASGRGRRLLDLEGDGQLDVVAFAEPAAGFYERTQEGRWAPFRAFRQLPTVDWNDPNLKFIDLDGNGRADILMTEQSVYTWYASLGEAGFSAARQLATAVDEEQGARLVFADGTQSVFLADMSGDGLSDMVRIRAGEVCYWPNLGYGRFGARVSMDNAPQIDRPETFDHANIRLADIDGSGTNDIIYLGADGVHLYFNQSGNRWSEARELTHFPDVDRLSSVMPVDLFGNGTACLVWSSRLPADAGTALRYVDLMGGRKPHLLVKMVNNLGAETRVHYSASTQFYLADKKAGRPWITRIPFPVQVIERVETVDRISRNRFITRYAYHHGYFDGAEREFRGFGLVEQWDSEAFAALGADPTPPEVANEQAPEHVPPVYIKTWFHTGAYLGRNRVSRYFAGLLDDRDTGEYYREPGLTDAEAQARLLDDTLMPPNLSLDEEREACRALKGSMLREEIYALDGTDKARHPYSVREQNFTVRPVQGRHGNRHAVFFTHPREALAYQYERDPTDPRISHTLTLQVDDYGSVTKEASIAYARRQAATDPAFAAGDHLLQSRPVIMLTENRLTNPVILPDSYRKPQVAGVLTWELTGFEPENDAERFSFGEWTEDDFASLREAGKIAYQAMPDWNQPQKRIIEYVRTLYRRDTLDGLLPFGELHSRALPGETYHLALTAELIDAVFERPRAGLAAQALLANADAVLGGQGGDQGGYVASQTLKADGRFPDTDPDGDWWLPSGRVFYSTSAAHTAAEELQEAGARFFTARRFVDPFGQQTVTDYDRYDLLLQGVRDRIGNRTTAGHRLPNGDIDPAVTGQDYRVLQPWCVSDANRNRSQVVFDALGMVVGTAALGKPEENLGDSLAGFVADLTEAQTRAYIADPLAAPHDLLNEAGSRLLYDLFACYRTRAQAQPDPVVVCTLARERHVSDLLVGEQTPLQHSFTYSDGFEREIQRKFQAEPERINGVDGPPRWVGSGWTVFNNKGNPVREFEPFFSATPAFEFGIRQGVSPVRFYDPLERVVATLYPNSTYEKRVFDAWHRQDWDVNDTVDDNPRTDLDIGGYVAPYLDALEAGGQPWQSWHQRRANGALGTAEKDAADKALAHAETPATAHFDLLGRTFLSLEDNGPDPAQPGQHLRFASRSLYDSEGNVREVRDAVTANGDTRGRVVMRYDYDMLGNRIREISMEAGTRWMLNDASEQPIRIWDSRGQNLRNSYDRARRLLKQFVAPAGSGEKLVERRLYGEQHPEREIRNLREQLYLQLDQAGSLETGAFDFKGNPLHDTRRLANDVTQTIDWAAIDANPAALPADPAVVFDNAQLQAALGARLENERYTGFTRYDALDRPVTRTAPHSAAMSPSVIRMAYNEATLLARVEVNLHGARQGGQPVWTPFVDNIDYDAKGQRTRIDYGNGALSLYEYDPLTYRLVRMHTRRDPVVFPGDCPDPPDANWPGCDVQDLHYSYDPAGNVTRLRDSAQQTIFFRNRRVEPDSDYTYDPLYRLIRASGREHMGQGNARVAHAYNDVPRVGIDWAANDGKAMGTYVEDYLYDAVGNLLSLQHRGIDPASAGWTRTCRYKEKSQIDPAVFSNRLTGTAVGANDEQYSVNGNGYDAHGNMLKLPQLQAMQWDHRDQLRMTRRQAVDAQDAEGAAHAGERTWYVYGADGERVRKVTFLANGDLKDERIYLGEVEIYRKHAGNNAGLERETLHVMDGERRIAMVETRNAVNDGSARQLLRYQLGNHLNSAMIELDAGGQTVSYEEYFPFGATAVMLLSPGLVRRRKRYRFTGRERDTETGLQYHSARYYIPWLARWLNPDPLGLADGDNLYRYAQNNPVALSDIDGTLSKGNKKFLTDARAHLDARVSALEKSIKAKEAAVDKRVATDKGYLSAKLGREYDKKAKADAKFKSKQTKADYIKQKLAEYRETLLGARNVPALRTKLGEMKALKTFYDTHKFTDDSLILANVVVNEAGTQEMRSKEAIAYGWLNRTGGGVREPTGAEISDYKKLEKRLPGFTKSNDKDLFLTQFMDSVTAADKRLADKTPSTNDPTKGATHWISPDADVFDKKKGGNTQKRTINGRVRYVPQWARSNSDPKIKSLQTGKNAILNKDFKEITGIKGFLFYKGVK